MTEGTDWVEQARRLVAGIGLSGDARFGDGPGAGHVPGGDCRWCPLCQLVAVLRGERPEVAAVLAIVLRTTADALHAFAAAPDGARAQPPAADEPPGSGAGRPPPVVQRIEIA